MKTAVAVAIAAAAMAILLAMKMIAVVEDTAVAATTRTVVTSIAMHPTAMIVGTTVATVMIAVGATMTSGVSPATTAPTAVIVVQTVELIVAPIVAQIAVLTAVRNVVATGMSAGRLLPPAGSCLCMVHANTEHNCCVVAGVRALLSFPTMFVRGFSHPGSRWLATYLPLRTNCIAGTRQNLLQGRSFYGLRFTTASRANA